MRIFSRRFGICLQALILGACASAPEPPRDLQGNALVVMGFTTDETRPYEGGTLYTGLRIDTINGQSVGPIPLTRYDSRPVPPGKVSVDGYCFWRLRTLPWDAPPDLQEPAHLEWEAQSNHVYTLAVSIDEYKATCNLSLFDRAIPGTKPLPDAAEQGTMPTK